MPKSVKSKLTAGAALALGTALVPEAAHAANFTVTNTNDSGSGSLRDAVAQANATSGGDSIDFTVSGTITLASGVLNITESVTINGPGAETLTIAGNGTARIFNITDSNAALQDVTIVGLTLRDGLASGTSGGAIRSQENLTIVDTVITENAAQVGGALHQSGETLTMVNVQITGNSATNNIGGVWVDGGTSAALFDVNMTNNSASNESGAALFDGVDTLLFERGEISGNSSGSNHGGFVIETVASATIREVTISGNETNNGGGGLSAFTSTVTIETSTISGNSADFGGGGYLLFSDVTLKHTTVSGNSAGSSGGNFMVAYGSLELENSIVANGTAPVYEDFAALAASVAANYSLVEVPPAGMTGANNVTGADPQLGPLQDNGGTRQTHLPSGTSPVLDAGDPSFVAPPTHEQRGHARVANGTIDMGSVEVTAILSLSSATYSVGEDEGTITITVNRTGGSDAAVAVGYVTSSGTATSGEDYQDTSGALSWPDGDTAPKTFDITILNNSVFDGDAETIDVTLSNPEGGSTLAVSSAVVTINEDDPVTLSIGDVSQLEGASGTSSFVFPVTIPAASSQTIMVSYTTNEGTADDPTDFTGTSGTLTFLPGDTQEDITVQVNGDTDSESEEQFTVTLSSPVNANIADGTAEGTIVPDDNPLVVSTTNNNGAGSLRSIIATANSIPGANTITFAVTGTITLSDEILITESLTIDGPGSSSLTISGDEDTRLFRITDDSSPTLQNIFIDGLTLADGDTNQNGGAILNSENLTVTDVRFFNNAANKGGAVYHDIGAASFTDVRAINNRSDDEGGAFRFYIADVTIDRSTISGNTAGEYGGGVYSENSDLVLTNSTVSGNTSGTDTRADYRGGGGFYLYDGGTATIRNSTIVNNTSPTKGGNIATDIAVTIENSIVANGAAPAGPDINMGGGTVAANYSLIETAPGGMTGANNITGVDPDLGSLAGNGGPSNTHRPNADSPVVDAGNPAFSAPPSTDQRGKTRVINGTIDMGAVEVQNVVSLSSATYSVAENAGTLTVTINRAGSEGSIGVDYETSDGTAIAGEDFTFADGDRSWGNGDTSSKTFNVSITNDTAYEGSQTFNVELNTPTGEMAWGTASAVVTITDDDTQPAISIGNVSLDEGNSGTTSFTFPVTLSNGSTETITVGYSTANGSAAAGSDYTAASGTVTFTPGDTTENVVVSVSGDATVETDETFTVTLASPTNATIANGTGTGTIESDDTTAFGAPTLFSATAISTSAVFLNWAPVNGATSYEVFRATSVLSGYSLLTTTSNTTLIDGAVSANTTYLYKVRAIGSGTSAFSAIDAATTISFTDATLSTSTQIKAVHITQLRTAVNAMRAAAGLSAGTYTDPTITAQSTVIKAAHINELRTSLNGARAIIGLATISFTDPTITTGSTTVKTAHVAELRAGTQ